MGSLNVEILTSVPGSGKTKAILKHVGRSRKPTIIASISCQLSKQSYDFFTMTLGYDNAIILDTDNIKKRASVYDSIKESIGKYRVIFITHSALMNFPHFDLFEGHELYIDEVPDMVDLRQVQFKTNIDVVSRYCDIASNGRMTVVEKHRKTLEEIAMDGMHNLDVVSNSVFPLVKALLTDIPVIIKDSCAYFVEDMSTQSWELFTKITIACANFRETFTGVVLKEYAGWEFVESPLVSDLDFRNYKNTQRIEIIPMYDGNWSRYASDIEIGGETVYNKVKDIVYNVVGPVNYIYTTNSYRGPLNGGTKIPYNPHGMNNYMNFSTAVALFSYNPSPWQLELLKSLSYNQGLDVDHLTNAFLVSKYLEPAFQLCLRTDIRNNKSMSPVRLIVPDMRVAEYLKNKYLPDANIDCSLMIFAEKERKPRKKETTPRARKESFKSIFCLDNKEQSALSYYQKQIGRKLSVLEPTDIALVSDWISTRRKSK
ncbi:hypothetical protein [Aeromonas phage AS-sw]|uniref:Uncharacterized protein n=1 Tax=Aeromonas phage AS-sw TaxID=2026113 RepID=A0A291LFY4_9CAUD|nr:hypothetical protein HWB29_gp256 [Aeromonas phage AS-sw]ATI18306.1 hypothetical protein [Aeromonas phage AS-sw]